MRAMNPRRLWAMGGLLSAAALCLSGTVLWPRGITRAPVPGAVDPAVTQATVQRTVCRLHYTTTVRPPLEWSREVKARLLIEQHLPGRVQDYELDHLIPIELGGAPRDSANLWMQRWDEARIKDDQEGSLRDQVCAGRVTLAEAQHRIVAEWGPR